MSEQYVYAAIDLKSFYASVECKERDLDPLNTNLVVADASRTEKTICLAVSPSLKSYGIPGRPRLFEVVQKVREINRQRKQRAKIGKFTGSSWNAAELQADEALALDFITAVPQMAKYLEYSALIYKIYLQYFAAEDIKVYSVDEVFIDLTKYLPLYKLKARELIRRVIKDVYQKTGITATAGIGTNLYLAKVAMDITAKHAEPDEAGARIAFLDEMSYRKKLWTHRPLTDFWRVGKGYAQKLYAHGLLTMGDIALCSVGKANEFYNEGLLYKLFGKNAELLIDHAWGWEPCTMADIKAYQPSAKSMGAGQVLQCAYSFDKAKIIVREMAEQLALDLFSKKCAAAKFVLTIGYDKDSLQTAEQREKYQQEAKYDSYGRLIPKHAQGTVNLPAATSSAKQIAEAAAALFERIANREFLVRRVNFTASEVITAGQAANKDTQLSLFGSEADSQSQAASKELRLQETVLALKSRFGKNAVLKGTDLQDGATAILRNGQIGGHRA